MNYWIAQRIQKNSKLLKTERHFAMQSLVKREEN